MQDLDQKLVDDYRRDGFVKIEGVLSPEEVERFRAAAEHVYEHGTALNSNDGVFKQVVNVWREDETLRELALHPKVAGMASQLAGVPLRLWHDHLLVKAPHNEAPTEFHQDAPYWPHTAGSPSLSAWIALVEVPEERGCMSFLPGKHHLTDLPPVDLHDAHDLMGVAPELIWSPRVTVPLKAGDLTFHSGYTPHTASSNRTDDPRIAFVTIYVHRDVAYTGTHHVITDPLGLEVGDLLPDEVCPPV